MISLSLSLVVLEKIARVIFVYIAVIFMLQRGFFFIDNRTESIDFIFSRHAHLGQQWHRQQIVVFASYEVVQRAMNQNGHVV